MIARYTKEQNDYLREIVPGNTFATVTDLLNDKFGTTYTCKQIKAHCNNLKLRNGCRKGVCKGYSFTFTPEQQQFLADNVKGRTTQELTDMLNKKFGTEYKPGQIKAYKKNHHIRSGLDFRFSSGHTYKLPKGTIVPGCEKTWFKKGNTPHNHVEVGTETVTADGYIKVKTAEPNKWEFKHKLVWTAANGPIPPGHNLIFLDFDRTNCDLSNLYLIPRDQYGTLQKLRSEDPEITLTAAAVVKLLYTAKERAKHG